MNLNRKIEGALDQLNKKYDQEIDGLSNVIPDNWSEEEAGRKAARIIPPVVEGAATAAYTVLKVIQPCRAAVPKVSLPLMSTFRMVPMQLFLRIVKK